MADSKKALNQSFVDNNEDVNEDVASEQIVKATQKIRELELEREADERYQATKQILKDLNAAYTASIKYERAKINFFLEKIAEIQDGSVNPSSGANS